MLSINGPFMLNEARKDLLMNMLHALQFKLEPDQKSILHDGSLVINLNKKIVALLIVDV